jgi:hypothetical protein
MRTGGHWECSSAAYGRDQARNLLEQTLQVHGLRLKFVTAGGQGLRALALKRMGGKCNDGDQLGLCGPFKLLRRFPA